MLNSIGDSSLVPGHPMWPLPTEVRPSADLGERADDALGMPRCRRASVDAWWSRAGSPREAVDSAPRPAGRSPSARTPGAGTDPTEPRPSRRQPGRGPARRRDGVRPARARVDPTLVVTDDRRVVRPRQHPAERRQRSTGQARPDLTWVRPQTQAGRHAVEELSGGARKGSSDEPGCFGRCRAVAQGGLEEQHHVRQVATDRLPPDADIERVRRGPGQTRPRQQRPPPAPARPALRPAAPPRSPRGRLQAVDVGPGCRDPDRRRPRPPRPPWAGAGAAPAPTPPPRRRTRSPATASSVLRHSTRDGLDPGEAGEAEGQPCGQAGQADRVAEEERERVTAGS